MFQRQIQHHAAAQICLQAGTIAIDGRAVRQRNVGCAVLEIRFYRQCDADDVFRVRAAAPLFHRAHAVTDDELTDRQRVAVSAAAAQQQAYRQQQKHQPCYALHPAASLIRRQ